MIEPLDLSFTQATKVLSGTSSALSAFSTAEARDREVDIKAKRLRGEAPRLCCPSWTVLKYRHTINIDEC